MYYDKWWRPNLTAVKFIDLYPRRVISQMNSPRTDKVNLGTDNAPTRAKDGTFHFKDFPHFLPNRSPKEILQAGSFGGTYFRPIRSAVCPKVKFGDEVWKELPKDWIEGLDPSTQLTSSVYKASINKYGVKCGASLEEWEQSGWIKPQDPYGWFQWFCRFFQGRRSPDDDRQMSRWVACAGEKSGRWRNRLCKTVFQQNKRFNDYSASPVIRQTLLHWGYELTEDHYRAWGQRQGAESVISPATSIQKGSTEKRKMQKIAHARSDQKDDGSVNDSVASSKTSKSATERLLKKAKRTIEDADQVTSINRTSNPDKPTKKTN